MTATAPKHRGLPQSWAPYALTAPFLLIFAVFVLYPLGISLWLSTQQSFGPAATTNVGLRNFEFLFQDPIFWIAVRNTTLFTLGSVFIQLPLALGLAILLNSNLVRAKALFRLVFFAPQLIGLAFVGILGSVVFEKRVGLMNMGLDALLGLVGLGWDADFPWLDRYILAALIIAALWMYVGFNMVYFLAALQGVDRSLTEAAMIDGAGPWRRFTAVTLPAIAPIAGFVTLLSIIGSLQLFELPFLMLDSSAGAENRGLTIVLYLYQQGFEQGDLGYASAVGWVLALALIALALAYRALAGRTEAA